jgi:hypothetical protein
MLVLVGLVQPDDYENELNENKRSIKLLKPEFVSAVEKEFKKVIKQ